MRLTSLPKGRSGGRSPPPRDCMKMICVSRRSCMPERKVFSFGISRFLHESDRRQRRLGLAQAPQCPLAVRSRSRPLLTVHAASLGTCRSANRRNRWLRAPATNSYATVSHNSRKPRLHMGVSITRFRRRKSLRQARAAAGGKERYRRPAPQTATGRPRLPAQRR